MDVNRAMEIMESIPLIKVNYHGTPVYIQDIDVNQDRAVVFPLDEMQNEQMVDLQGLSEVPSVPSSDTH